uniref:Uncharacterized protein n=1 Tax=Knipowitschia caucasica TaxID=637954 RepID=A0AAV2M0J6_KNICA
MCEEEVLGGRDQRDLWGLDWVGLGHWEGASTKETRPSLLLYQQQFLPVLESPTPCMVIGSTALTWVGALISAVSIQLHPGPAHPSGLIHWECRNTPLEKY